MNELLQRKRKGAAVPLAVIAIMILLAMGVGLLCLGGTSRVYAVRTSSAIAARSAADSGLAMAIYEMNEELETGSLDDDNLPSTNELLPNCDSAFSYTVTRDSSGNYTIESTGTAGRSEKVVGCTLKFQGAFDYAIFGAQGLELKNSAKVDWYNYDEDDKPPQIGTNSIDEGAVILKNSAYINGDVVVGVGGDPDVAVKVDGSGEITGDILVPSDEHQLPDVSVPEWLDLLPSSGTLEEDATISSSAKYSSINLKNSKTVKITGDVCLYVTGDTSFGNSVEIEIDDDASLILYLGGNLEQKNSSKLNNKTEDPRKLQIYGLDGCRVMDFKNSSEMYGTIYAPNADVVMHNSNKIYGAIIAKSLEWKNSGELYYDASLRDVSLEEAISFKMTKWYEN